MGAGHSDCVQNFNENLSILDHERRYAAMSRAQNIKRHYQSPSA